MAQLLLSFGADPYVGKDSKGEMKTAYDVFMTKNPTAAQILMNRGIACNEQDLSSSNLLIIYDLEPFRKHITQKHGEMSLHQKIVQKQLKVPPKQSTGLVGCSDTRGTWGKSHCN